MMFGTHKKLQVLCVGSASKDIFFPTGEGVILDTPEDLTAQQKVAFELGGKYKVDDLYEAPGGVAANVATALAKLGIQSGVYSCVGDDETGRWIASELKHAGVVTERMTVLRDARTDLSAVIVLTQTGERTIFHNRDANEKLHVVPKDLLHTDWLFISALNGAWEENLTQLLEAAKAHDIRIALNPGQHNIRDNPKAVLQAIGSASLLVLNKDEALELALKSGEVTDRGALNDEQALIRFLADQGVPLIALTNGMHGAWGYDGQAMWHCVPGTVERVVDTTGAGDGFTGAFFAGHILRKPLSEMLAMGVAEGGSVVTRYGASAGLCSLEELSLRASQIIPQALA